MPTATSFTWVFPWQEMTGGFNAFIGMMNTPIALAVALILVFVVTGFVIGVIRHQQENEEIDRLLTSGEVADYYNDPRFDGPRWDDYTSAEHREFAEQYMHGFRFFGDDEDEEF